MITIPVSIGELIDKITILRIKQKQVRNTEQLINIGKELGLLTDIAKDILANEEAKDLVNDLRTVNATLWMIEDNIRDLERRDDFGAAFIDLARQVYVWNDRRSVIKKEINNLFKSELVEEKSYKSYRKRERS